MPTTLKYRILDFRQQKRKRARLLWRKSKETSWKSKIDSIWVAKCLWSIRRTNNWSVCSNDLEKPSRRIPEYIFHQKPSERQTSPKTIAEIQLRHRVGAALISGSAVESSLDEQQRQFNEPGKISTSFNSKCQASRRRMTPPNLCSGGLRCFSLMSYRFWVKPQSSQWTPSPCVSVMWSSRQNASCCLIYPLWPNTHCFHWVVEILSQGNTPRLLFVCLLDSWWLKEQHQFVSAHQHRKTSWS